jgi:hypothetical protein
MLSSYTFVYDRVYSYMPTQFLCEKVGNSEKSSETLKIQNGKFEKNQIRSAVRLALKRG